MLDNWCLVHGTGYMLHGARYIVHGARHMVHGVWYMVHGACCVIQEKNCNIICDSIKIPKYSASNIQNPKSNYYSCKKVLLINKKNVFLQPFFKNLLKHA